MHGEPAGRGHDGGAHDGADASTGAIDEATPGVDAVLGREVAMVVLPPAAGDDLVLRTERVRRLAGLHHPNLVEIFDVDGLAADTQSTLVMQNVNGRGLDEITGPWRAEPLARVAAQASAGLAHAHTHAVVHGAIGAASVVVDAGLRAWLTGFTATLRPDTDPAVDADGGPPTPQTDVAMLGRTLYDALGGTGPASLTTVLTAMIDGAVTAREAAERFIRAAENLGAGEEDTGLIALPTRYTRRDGVTDVPEGDSATDSTLSARTVVTGHPASSMSTTSAPGPVPLAVVPSPTPPPGVAAGVTPPDARAGRRARHGRRAALLGGAAVTVALASAFALWASEGPSGPATARPSGSTESTGRPVDHGSPVGGTSSGDRDVDATRATSRDTTRASRTAPDATHQDVLPGPSEPTGRPAPAPARPPVVPAPPLPPRPTVPSSAPSTPSSTTSTAPSSTPTSSVPSSSSSSSSPTPTTRTSRSTPNGTTASSSRGTARPDASRNPAALAAGR